MQLPPLEPARLIRRYKRFLADVELAGGEVTTVHCPNPGAMTGLALPGMRIWLSTSPVPTRKYRFTWMLSETEHGLVGIDTALPNRLVAEAIAGGRISELAGYDLIEREVRAGADSRIDFRLRGRGRPDCWVEIKNVHLERSGRMPGLAEFPDSVTARGTRHMRVLGEIARSGARAVILFVVQRPDCGAFSVASDIDARYAESFAQGLMSGVEGLCYDCSIELDRIEVRRPLPMLPAGGAAEVFP